MSAQLGLPFDHPAPVAPIHVSPLAPASGSLAPTTARAVALAGDVYFVRHRTARRYRLRVDPDGRARVTIPRGGSRREADAFVQRCLGWIARQRARLTAHPPIDDRARWRAEARAVLPHRLLELAADHGLEVSRISIRDQRTRWGSCGRDGHICLNWRLMLMPSWVRDYVLIHELMHLRRLDHSPRYWRLVAAACPEYQEARHWLRLHGPSLR